MIFPKPWKFKLPFEIYMHVLIWTEQTVKATKSISCVHIGSHMFLLTEVIWFLFLFLQLPSLIKNGSTNTKTLIYHNIGILLGALVIILLAIFESKIDIVWIPTGFVQYSKTVYFFWFLLLFYMYFMLYFLLMFFFTKRIEKSCIDIAWNCIKMKLLRYSVAIIRIYDIYHSEL